MKKRQGLREILALKRSRDRTNFTRWHLAIRAAEKHDYYERNPSFSRKPLRYTEQTTPPPSFKRKRRSFARLIQPLTFRT
jgi:hypothetical protein